jgi:hypothetical protein
MARAASKSSNHTGICLFVGSRRKRCASRYNYLMTKPAGFTQASLKRAINSVRKAGLHVMAVTADGTVLVSDIPVDPNLFRIQAAGSSPYEHTEA